MENKMPCNLETVAVISKICKEMDWDMAKMLDYIYPRSVIDLGGAEGWAKDWKNKIVVDKMTDDLKGNPNVVVVNSLTDDKWRIRTLAQIYQYGKDLFN